MNYIVIVRSREGDVSVTPLAQQELESRLAESYWSGIEWLDALTERDPQYWKGDYCGVIIKGEVVTPKPVEVTTKWSVP